MEWRSLLGVKGLLDAASKVVHENDVVLLGGFDLEVELEQRFREMTAWGCHNFLQDRNEPKWPNRGWAYVAESCLISL